MAYAIQVIGDLHLEELGVIGVILVGIMIWVSLITGRQQADINKTDDTISEHIEACNARHIIAAGESATIIANTQENGRNISHLTKVVEKSIEANTRAQGKIFRAVSGVEGRVHTLESHVD